jgi:hypothetical protein
MNALETYLTKATRGVYGAKKREIMLELRGNIEARTWQLECRGLTPDQALDTALRELGAASSISLGLIKEHTMPKIFRSTLLMGLFLASSLTAFNASRAQVEVITLPPVNNFVDSNGKSIDIKLEFPDQQPMYYLNFSSLKENLEQLGLQVDDTPMKLVDSGATRAPVPTLRVRFPEASRDTFFQTAPGTDSPYRNEDDQLVWHTKPKANISMDRMYLSAWSFMHQIRKTRIPIRVEGWRNPYLVIGKSGQTRLQIGSSKQGYTPWQWYSSIAGRVLETGYSWDFSNNNRPHAVRVNAPAGTVFAVATPYQMSRNANAMNFLDIARVGNDGLLYFKVPHDVLEFTQNRTALNTDFRNLKKFDYGSSSRPAKALLIRVNSDLTTKFDVPRRSRSAAIK